MTSTQTTRLSADALAFQFFTRGLGGSWLSARQTGLLFILACDPRDLARGGVEHGKRYAMGRFVGDQMSASWAITLSPINGCAVFQCQPHTLADATAEVQKAAELVRSIEQTLAEDEKLAAAGFNDYIKGNLKEMWDRAIAELAGAQARRYEVEAYRAEYTV